jgi:hypothetical protein
MSRPIKNSPLFLFWLFLWRRKMLMGFPLFKKSQSAFLGSFGKKTAEHGLAFAAAAFGTFKLFLLSFFQREGHRIFLFAILTLELVAWHNLLSFLFLFVNYSFQEPRRS